MKMHPDDRGPGRTTKLTRGDRVANAVIFIAWLAVVILWCVVGWYKL